MTELELALAELRRLAQGIHPAVLSSRGLGPAAAAHDLQPGWRFGRWAKWMLDRGLHLYDRWLQECNGGSRPEHRRATAGIVRVAGPRCPWPARPGDTARSAHGYVPRSRRCAS